MDTIAGPTVDGMSSSNGHDSSHGIDDDFPSGLDNVFLPADYIPSPLFQDTFDHWGFELPAYHWENMGTEPPSTNLSSLPNNNDELSYLFSPPPNSSESLVDDRKPSTFGQRIGSYAEWTPPISFLNPDNLLGPHPHPHDMICTEIIQEHGVSPFRVPFEQLETILDKYEYLYSPSADELADSYGFSETSRLRDLTPSDLIHKDIPFECDINEATKITPLLRDYETNMQEKEWTAEVKETANGPGPQTSERSPILVSFKEGPRRRQRIPSKRWEEVRDVIEIAYIRNGNTLKKTMKILQDDFEFVTSYVYLFLLIVTLAKLYG